MNAEYWSHWWNEIRYFYKFDFVYRDSIVYCDSIVVYCIKFVIKFLMERSKSKIYNQIKLKQRLDMHWN